MRNPPLVQPVRRLVSRRVGSRTQNLIRDSQTNIICTSLKNPRAMECHIIQVGNSQVASG